MALPTAQAPRLNYLAKQLEGNMLSPEEYAQLHTVGVGDFPSERSIIDQYYANTGNVPNPQKIADMVPGINQGTGVVPQGEWMPYGQEFAPQVQPQPQRAVTVAAGNPQMNMWQRFKQQFSGGNSQPVASDRRGPADYNNMQRWAAPAASNAPARPRTYAQQPLYTER